jgi:branched-chain amino acid transport system substrate-binding protein
MRRSVSWWLTAFVAVGVGAGCRRTDSKEAVSTRPSEYTVEAPSAAGVQGIKLGQVMPYSGPASAYGTIGRLESAYFAMLNKKGGVNGRKIDLISLDDSYSPPKAVELVRRLVEQDKVLAIFNPVGTPSNTAIRKYLNDRQVPQLFVSSGASKWNDPQNYPWTIGFNPSYRLEGRTYAEHILKSQPKAKVAVLYQADDFGKDLLAGLKEGFGDKAASTIVAEATYEVTDPTIDSQLVTLKGSKADVVVFITTPKFGAQAVRKSQELGWKVTRYIANVAASVGSVLIPAGLDKAKGLITVEYVKDPTDPRWADDPAMKEWYAFMESEYPSGDTRDGLNAFAYVVAQTLVHVLTQCGDDLSRKNLMKQAASLKDFAPPMLLPGVKLNTSDTDFATFDQLELARFDGQTWAQIERKPGSR